MADIITQLGTLNSVPQPSQFDYEFEDTSAGNAGRTDDGTMHKEMTGRVLAISLSWENHPKDIMESVLSATSAQYFTATYYDPMTCASKTQTFYRGNVSVACTNYTLDIWTFSFKIIGQYNNQYGV